MSLIDFKFGSGPYGSLRGAVISNAPWYSAEDLCRALGSVDDLYLQKIVSKQNQAGHLQPDRSFVPYSTEIYVNNAGVNEFLKITSSSRCGKIKDWFDGLIVPQSENLVKQLEELNKNYRGVVFSVKE